MLAPERRTALIDWATRTDAFVLEDDYDAEYRYDRPPVGAVQGLAPDRVLYAGSVSKTLAPGLRLGWMVVPDRLAEAVVAAKASDDLGTPVVEQLALADFLERGELDRHLRRTRSVYRARRDALVTALARELPDCPPGGVAAGLHLVVPLPAGADEPAVLARGALARGRPVRAVGAPHRAGPARAAARLRANRRARHRRCRRRARRGRTLRRMSYEHLIWEQDGGVGRLTLNRPETLNAWHPEFGRELKRRSRPTPPTRRCGRCS